MTLRPRIRVAPALLLAACLVGAGTVASPAGAADSNDPKLTTSTLPAMRPGATAWVSTLWTAENRDADHFRLTASSSGATVSYPSNTATYSSFYGSSTLRRKATDFAALKVTINPAATSTVTLNLTATYDLHTNNGHDNRGHDDRDDRDDRDNDHIQRAPDSDRDDRNADNDDTVRRTQNRQITIPIQVVTGAAITPLTSALQPVARGSERWQQYSVRGEKPYVSSLTLRVTAPTGITIVYPADGTASKPNESSTLDVGETDYFGFKTQVASSVAPGTYTLTMSMSYGSGKQQSATATLKVT